MRHRKSFNHLGRTASHRKAMLANMASSLILHKRIETTTVKAKELRMYIEPLITKSKDDSTHSRRVVFSYLQDKNAVSELFREVSPKIAERPGGYTRILKTGTRLGDNADMCIIELVDYNENLLTAKEDSASKSGRRRRRGGKKKSDSTNEAAAAVTATAETATEEVKEEPKAEAQTEEVKVEETEAKAEEAPKAEEVEEKKEEPAAEAKAETTAEDSKAEETEKEEKKADDKAEGDEKKEA